MTRQRRHLWTVATGTVVTLFALSARGSGTEDWNGAEPVPRAPSVEVVGGNPVAVGDWPDCAAVLSGDTLSCTGVLIAPEVVMTAGHCIGGLTHVYLSTWDLSQNPGEVINVSQQIAYPNWWATYDLGLLLLESPSETTPRTIAHGCARFSIVDGADVTVVGWGAIDPWGTVFPTQLMGADITINDADCSDFVIGCLPAVSPNGELGAGGDGVDGCFGDSGGPLYLRTSHADLLVGITSRGFDTSTVPCGDGGIYVRPDAVIGWIEQAAGIILPEPICVDLVFADGFETGDLSNWSWF